MWDEAVWVLCITAATFRPRPNLVPPFFSFLIMPHLSCYWYFSRVFTARWRCHIDCTIHKLQCWLLVTCSYKTRTVFPEPVCVSLLMIKCWLYVLAGGSVKGSQYNTISHSSIALALKFSLALLYSLQLASICLKALGLWSNSAEVILWIPQTCLMFSLLHICDCVLSCYWWIIFMTLGIGQNRRRLSFRWRQCRNQWRCHHILAARII